jgi:hypothetical protein
VLSSVTNVLNETANRVPKGICGLGGGDGGRRLGQDGGGGGGGGGGG